MPEDEFDDTQEGKVITPLPPGQVHSTKGIVTPKPPFEMERILGKRYQDLPEELQDNDDF